MDETHTPRIGDIWFHERLNSHVLIMESDPEPRMAQQGWAITLELETNECNWFIIPDMPSYGWRKVA